MLTSLYRLQKQFGALEKKLGVRHWGGPNYFSSQAYIGVSADTVMHSSTCENEKNYSHSNSYNVCNIKTEHEDELKKNFPMILGHLFLISFSSAANYQWQFLYYT